MVAAQFADRSFNLGAGLGWVGVGGGATGPTARPGPHPDTGFCTWQARIPEPNGETVITRYTLRELLDKLGELMAGRGGESTRAAVDALVAARPEQGRNSNEAIAQRRGSRGV